MTQKYNKHSSTQIYKKHSKSRSVH